MNMRIWLGLAASLCTVPVLGQVSAFGADEFTDGGPAFGADELAAILTPARGAARGLTPGSSPIPGEPGSGVVPDLRVQFEFGSAELTASAKAQLDQLGRAMQTQLLQPHRFRVAGYTDSVGSDEYNEWLSQQRAAAVVSYLSATPGVTGERLDAMGFGERELADPEQPKSAVNRRVEVRTLE